MENDIKKLRQELREWIKSNTIEGLVGFQCWDCDKEIKDLNIDDENYKNNPISLNGYIQTICEECVKKEDEY